MSTQEQVSPFWREAFQAPSLALYHTPDATRACSAGKADPVTALTFGHKGEEGAGKRLGTLAQVICLQEMWGSQPLLHRAQPSSQCAGWGPDVFWGSPLPRAPSRSGSPSPVQQGTVPSAL